jgi:hypothetical protein
MNSDALEVWVIYDHPRDMPDCFIARLWCIKPDGASEATQVIRAAPTLEEVRAMLPRGLVRTNRRPSDDSRVVEVWL